MQHATFNMNAFFSPKSRIQASKPLARLMNTLNLLGPALLLCAMLLLGWAEFGDHLPAQQQTLLAGAAVLVAAAVVIRIAWGIGVRYIAAKAKTRSDREMGKIKASRPASLHAADHHDAGH